ncbi:MAG TPA: DUF362 domain-containing protein [Candidatus Binatia bacterium]|nr:DUF362 domain-containing protein [Candidatus Binatia bacterium]
MSSPEPRRVAVVRDANLAYPLTPPFDPPNPVYDAVCRLLRDLGLDAAHAGTRDWNPLGDLVGPGRHVVIKPNFVSSRNFHLRYGRDDFLCCCTHPSVIRPVIDLAARAVGSGGRISLAEAPLEGGDFETTLASLGVTPMLDALAARGVPVELIDFRDFRITPRMALDNVAIAGRSLNLGMLERQALPGDPRGYTVVDLAAASDFAALDGRCERLRFHHSNPGLPSEHHVRGRHEYSMPNTVLGADLLIGMPKMKSHKKTGVTLALKNMIGTTNQKYWLPHFTAGAPPDGDEYPVTPPAPARFSTFLSRVTLPGGHAFVLRFPPAEQREDPHIYDGNWSGNDTLWRTILDLNRIVRYADRGGVLRATPQRAVLALLDGIVAGEGNGPLAPEPIRCGVLVGGADWWATDWVATRMMGVDPAAIGFLGDAARAAPYPVTGLRPDDIEVVPPEHAGLRFDFKLPLGWRNVRAVTSAASV